jgi:hypothetical protein
MGRTASSHAQFSALMLAVQLALGFLVLSGAPAAVVSHVFAVPTMQRSPMAAFII